MKTETEHGNETVKIGRTRPLWSSEIFYSDKATRDKKGKKIAETKPKKYLVIPQPKTDHPTQIRDFEFIGSYTPTTETLKQTTARNLELNEILTPDQEKELSANLEESLKFSYPVTFKKRTYEKSLIIAKRRFELIHRGKLIRRTIKDIERTPPDYETFKVCAGFSYRFYFRDNANNKTVIRDIKTNRARVHPTRKIYYPTPSGLKAVKILLPLNKIVQLTPIKSIIYEIELKEGYRINTDLTDQPTRTHAKTEISIDYKQLAKAEKRISKKWFKLLTESLKDETLVSDLTPHLKKLRRKIITSTAITPNTLKTQKAITPRINTVENYNHKLRIDAVTSKLEMDARKIKAVNQ
uniref:Uncharacterized protein n=1 Tax=viral metagenome TaxID=1070528 RepID=A0A6M3MDR9_9ZZZZ